ncbi:MAG TPA: hypothetical protein VMB47_01240 [Candidatus Aquilonibacter sp.]|nr:hypothetical protein [Candidatus Aquilonibacter sp.]
MKVRLFLVLLALAAFAASTFAQTSATTGDEASQGAAPLQVSVVESHEMTVPGIEADVTNVSDKCVRGYVIELSFIRDDGTVLRTWHKMTVFRKPGSCLRPTVFMRGHEISAKDNNGQFITHGTASIELVVFSDGTEWGAGKSETAGELRGFLKAMDYARNPQDN